MQPFKPPILNSEKINLKVTSEKSVNGEDLKNASGDYEFQYLCNKVPWYIRKNPYRNPDFKLWYADGEWCLKRKDYHGDWNNGKVLLRKKSKCKFFSKA